MPNSTPDNSTEFDSGKSDPQSSPTSLDTNRPSIRVIRWPELQQKIGGRSLSAVARSENTGNFPARIRQGNHVGWLEHEIDEYLLTLPRGPRRD